MGSTNECLNDAESLRRERLFELVTGRLLSLCDEGACFLISLFFFGFELPSLDVSQRAGQPSVGPRTLSPQGGKGWGGMPATPSQ